MKIDKTFLGRGGASLNEPCDSVKKLKDAMHR